ncbi:MAG: DUF92 domain-containing protein [candidate division Zixibacteria bacterium]|nr:DUF92 domain-containing protein [candidate division Zixibacteria bacterium]
MLYRLLAGLVFSAAISLLSKELRLLTTGGAVAATLIGATVFGWGGWDWAASLVFFFVSSSVLTRVGRRRKAKLIDTSIQKSARDYRQVLANGLLPASCVSAYALTSHSNWYLIFLGTLACATADTWGTEIGLLSNKKPVSIITGKMVKPGVSGGITLPGVLASLAGGISLATVGLLASQFDFAIFRTAIIISFVGLAGSIVDSILGATVQGQYQCQICGSRTELNLHCQKQALKLSGLGWIDNNRVNLISSLLSALLTFFLISV